MKQDGLNQTEDLLPVAEKKMRLIIDSAVLSDEAKMELVEQLVDEYQALGPELTKILGKLLARTDSVFKEK